MTWLNSLEEKINGNIIFLTTAKGMWDTLKMMYDNEKNPSRVFVIYERLFELNREISLWLSSMQNSRVWLMSWRCINLL